MNMLISITLAALAAFTILRSTTTREAEREPLFLIARAVSFAAAGVWAGL